MAGNSDSKLLKVVRWGFVAAFALLVAHFIWTYSADQAHRSEAHQRAEQYAADAQKRITQTCVKGERQAFFAQCVAEIVDATRESQRAEHNLNAQQEMAEWTRLMTLASGIAIFISGLGLWALVRTIRQGQEALNHARHISDLETRPILMPDGHGAKAMGEKAIFRFKWKNVGKLPAIIVSGDMQFTDALGDTQIVDWLDGAALRKSNQFDKGGAIIPEGKRHKSSWCLLGDPGSDPLVVYVYGKLTYNSVIAPRKKPWVSEVWGTLIWDKGNDPSGKFIFESVKDNIRMT